MNQVKIILIGAGNRGQAYANYITKHPHLGKIIAVAEPRKYQRELIVKSHNIGKDNTFDDWQ